MKVVKWIAGIGGVLLLLLLLLAMGLTSVIETRQASVKPLTLEDLPALRIEMPTVEAPAAAEANEPPGKDAEEAPSPVSADLSRLAHRPTEDDVKRHTLSTYTKAWDIAFTRVYMGGLKRVEALSWLVAGGSSEGMLREICYESWRNGDYQDTKGYLRELLPMLEAPESRRSIYGKLAWLEEDPAVAAALLREACAGNDRNQLGKARSLAIVTKSEALANHYHERLAQLPPLRETPNTANLRRRYADSRVQAWVENREARDMKQEAE